MKEFSILVINPGSTSDEVAVFRGGKKLFHEVVRYSVEEMAPFDDQPVTQQLEFRRALVLKSLEKNQITPASLDAVIGRGGLLRPIPSGTYTVNERMLADLRHPPMGEHPSNLGGLIAHDIACEVGIPSFIADPVVVDELDPLARYSGFPELPRVSIFHALNQKRVARIAAEQLGKTYEEARLIVAHGGGGISIGAHLGGRVVDVNNGLDGEGPMTPQRAGTVPAGQLVRLCFSEGMTPATMRLRLKGRGGIVAHAGSSDLILLERLADGVDIPSEARACLRPEIDDKKAKELLDAMVYQLAKSICALAATLCGKVDAIVFTGGLAYGKKHMVEPLRKRVEWLAPLFVFPGGDEMAALHESALRVLEGRESPKTY